MTFPFEKKIVALEALLSDLKTSSDKKITTNGCFDILHYGHIHYLAQAKSLEGKLICLLNSDTSVKKIKGPDRPFFSERTRAFQLAALEVVDYVVLFSEETPVRALEKIQPHIHVKGADYAGKDIPELHAVKKWGGKLEYLEFVKGFSTSSIAEKVAKT